MLTKILERHSISPDSTEPTVLKLIDREEWLEKPPGSPPTFPPSVRTPRDTSSATDGTSLPLPPEQREDLFRRTEIALKLKPPGTSDLCTNPKTLRALGAYRPSRRTGLAYQSSFADTGCLERGVIRALVCRGIQDLRADLCQYRSWAETRSSLSMAAIAAGMQLEARAVCGGAGVGVAMTPPAGNGCFNRDVRGREGSWRTVGRRGAA